MRNVDASVRVSADVNVVNRLSRLVHCWGERVDTS